MSRFAVGGPPGAKFNDMSHFGPFLRVSIEGWPQFTRPPWKIIHLVFLPNFFWESQYTPCNRVSRPFPIWSIWQIWPLLGQNNMFFGGLVNWGNQIWIVFGWVQGFLGHKNDFWKFQKVSKILTKNSVKNTGNFSHLSWPTEPLFERFRNFP